jgi:hypothetical protein
LNLKDTNQLVAGMKGKSISSMSSSEEGGREAASEEVVNEMLLKVNEIFNILKAFYTQHRVALGSSETETSIREQWAYELAKSGITEDMLEKGMSRAKTHSNEDKWTRWPSISNFVSWCFSLPTPEQAYKEACDNSRNLAQWSPSHPAVGLAGRDVTWFTLNNLEQSKSEPRYRIAYTALCERVMSGEALSYEPNVMIEHKPLTPEELKEEQAKNFKTGRANLGGLKAMLGKREVPAEEKYIPAPEHKPDYAAIEKRKRDIAKLKSNLQKGGDL